MISLATVSCGQNSAQIPPVGIAPCCAFENCRKVMMWPLMTAFGSLALPRNRYPSPYDWSDSSTVRPAFFPSRVSVANTCETPYRQGFADGLARLRDALFFAPSDAHIEGQVNPSKGRAECKSSNYLPFRPSRCRWLGVWKPTASVRLQVPLRVRSLRMRWTKTSLRVLRSVLLAARCATTQGFVTKTSTNDRASARGLVWNWAIGACRPGGLLFALVWPGRARPNEGRDG
jgi:hypothetical protein